MDKVNLEPPLASAEQPLPSAEQPIPSADKQEIKELSATPIVNQSIQSAKLMTAAREESPPPPPPPSTTGAVAVATNNPHYASTSTSYSQSATTPTPGSEGYSAYLQVSCVYVSVCLPKYVCVCINHSTDTLVLLCDHHYHYRHMLTMQLMHKHKLLNIMLTTLRLLPMPGCTRPMVVPMATLVAMATNMIAHHTTTMQQEHTLLRLRIILILPVHINQKMIAQ